MNQVLERVCNLVRVIVAGGRRRKQEHFKEGIYKVYEKQLKGRKKFGD